MVSIEAFLGQTFPNPFVNGTFWGRCYGNNQGANPDFREPLPSTFGAVYFENAAFDGGTDLLVWRDSRYPTDRRLSAARRPGVVPAGAGPGRRLRPAGESRGGRLHDLALPGGAAAVHPRGAARPGLGARLHAGLRLDLPEPQPGRQPWPGLGGSGVQGRGPLQRRHRGDPAHLDLPGSDHPAGQLSNLPRPSCRRAGTARPGSRPAAFFLRRPVAFSRSAVETIFGSRYNGRGPATAQPAARPRPRPNASALKHRTEGTAACRTSSPSPASP